MARDLEAPSWLRTLLGIQLIVWGVGVLTLEAVASAGLVGCVAIVLAVTARDGWFAWKERLQSAWPLAAFIAWALVAPAVAGHLPTGAGVARLIDWAAVPSAACAFCWLDDRMRRRFVVIVGGVFVVSCVVAGLQHLGLWPSLETFRPLSWTRIPFFRVYERVPGTEERFMGGGLLFHRLKFAHVGGLVVVAFAALSFGLRGKDRALAAAVAVFGTISIVVFPFVRGASASLLVALLFLAFVMAPGLEAAHRRRLYAGAAALLLFGLLALTFNPAQRQRFLASATSAGSGDRDKILASGVRAVREHPIAGVGAGRFRPAFFATPDMPLHVIENTGKAHNQFLSMAAETGLVGGLLFIVMLGAFVRWMKSKNVTALGAQACLAFFALLSLAHDPLYQAPFSMALSLVLGIGWASADPRRFRTVGLQASRR